MTPEEKLSLQYRFGGYQMPKIQLDESGDSYILLDPHPYYYNQPAYWQKPAYTGNQVSAMRHVSIDSPVIVQSTVRAGRNIVIEDEDGDTHLMMPF